LKRLHKTFSFLLLLKGIPSKIETGVETFVEKYKGIRRLLLFMITYMCIDAYFATKQMYFSTQSVDSQWVIYQGILFGAWSIFFTFYTSGRTKEFNSDTPYSSKGNWMNKGGGAEP